MQYLLSLTILMAPAYALRFSLFGLPLNVLMVWIAAVWLVFAATVNWREFTAYVCSINRKVLIFSALFFAAGLLSLFYRGMNMEKLGQFLVLFLQPMSLFLIAGYTFKKNPDSKSLLLASCYLLLAAMGLFAAIQYFTLHFLPPQYWGNSVEPKRAVGFFTHPNFYALFIAPLLALLIPDVVVRFKGLDSRFKDYIILTAWIMGAIGLFLSMSRAGWLGLAAALGIYVLIAGDKKIRSFSFAAVIVMVIVIVSVPNLRYRVILPFMGEKSSVSRLSLWHTGVKSIKESPFLGLGLTGFSRNWSSLNTDPNLDTHNFPHNIFLDLWVETGIVGLISLVGLMSLMMYRGLRLARSDVWKLGVSLFFITFAVQGMIDNPYFKNDLAVVFWIVVSLWL